MSDPLTRRSLMKPYLHSRSATSRLPDPNPKPWKPALITYRTCDGCKHSYVAEMVVGIEGTPERLCPGCYHWWRQRSFPILQRDLMPDSEV